MYKIPAVTLFMGKNLIFVPECRSTNDLALQLCQKPFMPEGSVIITTNQTAGRGQHGNRWEAEPGKNLTCSIVLKPSFLAVYDQFYLNIFVSLAICDYLTENCTAKVQIKWPNDILITEKKICGILIENQIRDSRFLNSIIGIGLNINQRQFFIDTATGLYNVTGKEYDLQDCLEQLLLKLEIRYLQLKHGKLDEMKKEYLRSLYKYKQVHTFNTAGRSFNGIITGVDPTGRIEVLVNGEKKAFGVKEIKFN